VVKSGHGKNCRRHQVSRQQNMLLLTFSLSMFEGRSFLGLPPAAAIAAATLAAVDSGSCSPPRLTVTALDADAACLPPLALLAA
jgi:hypothetical protein